MKCLSLILAICLASTLTAYADGPVSAVISADPFGFLFFGPSAQAELAIGDRHGLVIGVRDLEQGWAAQEIAEQDGHDIRSGLLFGASWRMYHQPTRGLDGWYWGPRIEFGSVDTNTHDALALLAELEAGYTWVTRHRLTFTIGAQLGVGTGWNRGTTLGSSGADNRFYPVGNLLLLIGYAL